MSHYHVFICDRCAEPVKGDCSGRVPQYWYQLENQSSDGRLKIKQLCGKCFGLVERLIASKTLELIDVTTHRRAEIMKDGVA